MVIVDTSVWLQFLKRGEPAVRAEMNLLRARGEVAMVGPVLAELLQGARSREELDQLTDWLTNLPYIAETQATWAHVGRLAYQLSRRGMRVALVDLLIAALALEHNAQVYTLDDHFRRIPGAKLHTAGAS